MTQIQPHWGAKGHAVVNHLAATHLPPGMPDFFAGAADRLTALGGIPDRWKIPSLPNLTDVNAPGHFVDGELVTSYPATRSAYLQALPAGLTAMSAGCLPYAIAEGFDTLTADFALWRAEVHKHGADTELAHALADDAVRTAGIMGHYVGDASQPLHTTVHHDGWVEKVEPNPEHFTTLPGIHARFEIDYVNRNVTEDAVAAQMAAPSPVVGPVLDRALEFIATAHTQVKPVYRLDRDGLLDHPNPQATDLATHQLAAGAGFLRDLWAAAWTRSESLADGLPEPRS